MRKIVIFAAAALMLAGCESPKSEAEKFSDDLLNKMTLREKLGQMSQFRPRSGVVTGPEGFSYNLEDMIKAGEVGSILSLRWLEKIKVIALQYTSNDQIFSGMLEDDLTLSNEQRTSQSAHSAPLWEAFLYHTLPGGPVFVLPELPVRTRFILSIITDVQDLFFS